MNIASNVNQSAGSVRQLRSGMWQAAVTLGEGRGAKKRTKTFPTARAAKAWLAGTKADGVPSGDAAKMTVAQAFDLYLDAKVLARNTVEVFNAAKAQAVAQGISAVRLANLKPSQIAGFTAWLVRSGFAASTVNIYASRLATVLRFAAADGAMTFVPRAVKVRTNEHKPMALSPATVRALYEAATEDFAPVIILGAYAGLRASEAAAVSVGDIDFAAGTISVTKAVDDRAEIVATKTPRSMRTIPVPAEVLAELGKACKGRPMTATVAVNADGGALSTGSFAKTFARTAETAGVDVTFHALRKFFATNLLASGVNPTAAAKFLGDRVQTMLATYALELPTDADLARAAIASAFTATIAA